MKKILVVLVVLLTFPVVCLGAKKTTDFDDLATPTLDDIVAAVDSPGSSPVDKKITIANLVKMIEVDGHTDATNLTAAQVSGTVIYNTGQGAADVTLNLPTAAVGMSFIATVGTTVAANKWRVRAYSTDKIYRIGADGSVNNGNDNGYVGYSASSKYPTIGHYFSCFTFKTDAYDWICRPGTSVDLTAE
jgi:hypothetical protein